MKIFAPFGLLALAACAAPAADGTPSQAQPPAREAAADPMKQCDTAGVQDAIGKPFTDVMAAELQKKVGATSLRIIPPGMMVTMDYRSDRLNISYDEAKVITKVDCG